MHAFLCSSTYGMSTLATPFITDSTPSNVIFAGNRGEKSRLSPFLFIFSSRGYGGVGPATAGAFLDNETASSALRRAWHLARRRSQRDIAHCSDRLLMV